MLTVLRTKRQEMRGPLSSFYPRGSSSLSMTRRHRRQDESLFVIKRYRDTEKERKEQRVMVH